MDAYPLYRISGSKGFDFPLPIVRHEPQVRDTDVRSPFPPEVLGQDDNTSPLSVHGRQRSPESKGSGSCRSLPLVFRFRRSWSEQARQRGERGQVVMLYVIADAGDVRPPHFLPFAGRTNTLINMSLLCRGM